MRIKLKNKNIYAVILYMVMLVGLFTFNYGFIPAEAAAVSPENGNIYYIKNMNSGMYLTVDGDSSDSGANVIQSKGTGSLGQRWILEENSDGSYRLHPATDMTGGLSLDITNGSPYGGANVQIWANNGCSAQNFKITPSGNGYAITTAVTNYTSCLDVLNFSTDSGANVIQWTNNWTSNQVWYFEQAQWPGSSNSGSSGSTSSTPVSIDKTYSQQRIQLINTSNNNYLTAPNSMGNISENATSSKYNQWILMNDGSNRYMIVNSATGYVLAPNGNVASNGTKLVSTGKTGSSAQYWKISAVSTDCNGDGLAYKIINCADTNLAVTASNGSFVLGTYNGSSNQKFYVNSYGVEGFAGKCINMNGNTKASVTGGVFGKTVYVSDFDSLSKYCAGSTPYTIVINGNISKSSLTKINVGKNKTIIGSFSANTLNNVHFRCISDSGNVIFKNITFKHDASINANDDIQVYISNGNNFWIDHCTFPGHTIDSTDVDKLIYVGLKADYVSVTGCVFMNHKYGLILGYPSEDGIGTYSGYPQMTICNNYFYNVLTRAPGLMRYGYFHCYNNFVYGFNLAYTPYTDCNIYSERNYFDAGNYKGCVVDDHGVGCFTDSQSVLSWDISSIKTSASSFRPIKNYSYATRDASSAKAWCQKYTGVQSSDIIYAID